jgi:hypothetical protein
MAEAPPPGFKEIEPPPGFKEVEAPKGTGPAEGALGKVGRIAKEELGKIPGRIKEDVKGIAQTAMNPPLGTLLPLTLGPGAGLLPRIGSVTAGRVAESKPKSVQEAATAAVKEGGVAALWEAAFGVGSRLGLSKMDLPSLKSMGKRVETFDWATKAPLAAYNAIKDRVPPGKWMFVPSINPKAPISPLEAAEGLAKLEKLDYEVARKEIVQELNRLDMQRVGLPGLQAKGPRPYAGSAFETRTSKERFKPSGASYAAQAAISPTARLAADVMATKETEGGVPLGAYPFLMGESSLKEMARRWVPKP